MSICPSGTKGLVLVIDGGNCMRNRLADMGVFPGALVEVLRNEGGPVLLKVGSGRLALGRQMAERIMIA
jgi:ferrous iron transport protein A